jgi:hypothetical protein
MFFSSINAGLIRGVVTFWVVDSWAAGSAWGERMPELRSGVRQARLKAKKVEDLAAQDPAENLVAVAPTVAGRRGRGRGGRGGGRATGRGKAGGRGRGVPVIDLDPDQPCEVLPGAAIGGVAAGGPHHIEELANKVVKMDGGSAEKIGGGEDDGNASPVPDKVYSSY